ncbi:RNAse Z [Methanobrevibacter gottschalkii]|uniref:Ribonuclease Z n=2 Tax=Methanobrevibacter gottschalkii TaxID=190974 RepID=A0A3N5AZK0_9EURY|nr:MULTISPECIES: ribonuclease Z [Methanobrevibacter]MCQ2970515.1 ribonuclease Z [archaeon]OEC99580.1 ribonuclease Z [Methanobrevibacter sp. A27]RPF50504.1 RNAse Z [Methanobrevibacter gottschalkii DSM 11977]SEK88624.1 RNAse Z [Methanobrevibacter gottschalkii]
MEIIFLGTSSAVHSYTRNHPAIILKAFGEIILFDCGEGTQRQLIFAKISPMKISKIFISHYHGDHILGLPGLLQSMNFRGRETKLTIYGPKGLNALKNAILNLGYCKIDFPIEFIEIGTETIECCEEYIIRSQHVNHQVPCLAYAVEELKKPRFLRQKAIELGVPVGPAFGKLHNGEEIEINGKIIKPEQVLGPARKGIKITYSGDTAPCEEMIDFAKDSTILIHESTYMNEDADKAEENFHSTSSDAARIAKKSNSKQLVLTHFSTRYATLDDLLKEAKKIFKNTKLAKDFMKIEI